MVRQSTEQARLIELQTRQLERLNSEAAALRRAQAEAVTLVHYAARVNFFGVEQWSEEEAVLVVNESSRPIRDLCSRIFDSAGNPVPSSLVKNQEPPWRGQPIDDPATTQYEPVSLLRKGERLLFLWSFSFMGGPCLLRFTDDAGNRWQLDQDMHLETAPDDTW